MGADQLNLARCLSRSEVNGPGERFVVWTQGCSLRCPGCWNPDTWSFAPRELVEAEALISRILSTPGLEGVTFTGGEPFAQACALARVAKEVRAAGLSVMTFTGLPHDQLGGPATRPLLEATDILVAGPFVESLREDGLRWRGSSNQRVLFLSDKYDAAVLREGHPEVELVVGDDGAIALTGFPTMQLLSALR